MRCVVFRTKWFPCRKALRSVLDCWRIGRDNSPIFLRQTEFSPLRHHSLRRHPPLSEPVRSSLPGCVHCASSLISIVSALGVTFVVLLCGLLVRSVISILAIRCIKLWSNASQAMIFTLKVVPFVVSFMSFAPEPSTGPAAMQMPGVWC